MLEVSVQHGKTYIITNAAEGWVEFSAKKFMPAVLPILQKVSIISARAKFQKLFPTDVPQWKLHTFLETQKDLTDGNIKNLIAIGDSMFELDAAHNLASCF
jgi:predicted molibdopterin-dependent oxidoreductase YjgC